MLQSSPTAEKMMVNSQFNSQFPPPLCQSQYRWCWIVLVVLAVPLLSTTASSLPVDRQLPHIPSETSASYS
jgi:hypothetical protein